MRKILRLLGYGLLSFVSLDVLVAIADWKQRFDWVSAMLESHPTVGTIVRTPLFMVVPMALGFLFLWVERKISLPRLSVKLVNACLIPRLGTITVGQLFEDENKKDGWDQHVNDWDWFLELTVVNETENPTTVDEICCVASEVRRVLGLKVPRWVWPKADQLEVKHSSDFSGYSLCKKGMEIYATKEDSVPDLLSLIKGVALTKGIRYRGWIHLELPTITQHTLQRGEVNVWLLDSSMENMRCNTVGEMRTSGTRQ